MHLLKGLWGETTKAAMLSICCTGLKPEMISVPVLGALGILSLAPLKSKTGKHGQ